MEKCNQIHHVAGEYKEVGSESIQPTIIFNSVNWRYCLWELPALPVSAIFLFMKWLGLKWINCIAKGNGIYVIYDERAWFGQLADVICVMESENIEYYLWKFPFDSALEWDCSIMHYVVLCIWNYHRFELFQIWMVLELGSHIT